MNEAKKEKSAVEVLMQEWMKLSSDFLKSSISNEAVSPSASPEKDTKNGTKSRYLDSMETMFKRWQSISSTLNDPDAAETFLQGFNTLPEFFMTLAKAGWEASSRLQKQAMEKAGKIGRKSEAYSFDNLEQDLFKSWKEVYEEEFRQYFNIPQLGLMRYYQERFNRFLDQANLFQATLTEFMFILYLPVEKSFKVFQDQVEELSSEGKLPEKSKDYYQLWLRILEGHYMNLFRSSEYLSALRETLNQLETFAVAKNQFLQDMLQGLP
ncbi:MAG: poly(R)-hydroxyalkanoic acid synthase subunit PhaE, partial [Syntrophales bacterium]|nr:poly(R)-hydroxyalkanoic acid synthase subunit PhaE [Syntrophales bacterium]